jgi:N6-L-threonylcarbamoyladenine synthase
MHCEIEFPFLSMVVSGGHSAVYIVRDIGDYEEVASTRDDSAGEAFDKGAKMLGLGYPGGKVIDDLAKQGNRRAIAFPRGRVKADALAMSFSGLKTALWDYLGSNANPAGNAGPAGNASKLCIEDICASFQEAVVDVLVQKTLAARARTGHSRIVLGGGVAANPRLRTAMQQCCTEKGLQLFMPSPIFCTDNAAMIAVAGYYQFLKGDRVDPDTDAYSRSPLH